MPPKEYQTRSTMSHGVTPSWGTRAPPAMMTSGPLSKGGKVGSGGKGKGLGRGGMKRHRSVKSLLMILIASLSVSCYLLNLSQLNQSIMSHVLVCKDMMMSLARVFDESMLTFLFSKVVKDSIRGVSEFDRHHSARPNPLYQLLISSRPTAKGDIR